MRTPVQLGPVQETLLVPLWARAREADENPPLLNDPKSREILEHLAYDFSPLDAARASQLGCCVRGAMGGVVTSDMSAPGRGGLCLRDRGCA